MVIMMMHQALAYAVEKDEHIEVREASAWSLLSLGESPRVVLDPLIKYVIILPPSISFILVLYHISIFILLRFIYRSAKTDTDPNSKNRRLHSIHLLGELAGKDEEATETLLIILNSETDERIKEETVKSLGKLAQVLYLSRYLNQS